ncbi:MAG: hypothetical protein KF901_28435 [Myxococcales bacterium]|nr:hypothetical protein [Myxococcales bacterium]
MSYSCEERLQSYEPPPYTDPATTGSVATPSTYTVSRRTVFLSHDPDCFVLDKQDRLLSAGSTRYAYNDQGQLTERAEGAEVTSYDYDILGHLRSVSMTTAGTVTRRIEYLIDGAGRRVGRYVANGAGAPPPRTDSGSTRTGSTRSLSSTPLETWSSSSSTRRTSTARTRIAPRTRSSASPARTVSAGRAG